MATTTIPWGDGSGDNIYLTYPSASGDQTVQVSSDANTGSARNKTVTFTSGVGNITKTLTIAQEAGFVTIPYIRGGGTSGSYIDTGITADSNTKVIVWARNFNQGGGKYNWLFGSRTAQNDSMFELALGANAMAGSISFQFGDASNWYNDAWKYCSGYHKYEMSKDGLFVDDTQLKQASSATFSNSASIHLFGYNSSYSGHANSPLPADICACQIYKNGVLVRDFTAVNSPSVGLYDAVSDTVFTNAGSGSFTYGTFNPNAYTTLEYITCSQQQWFNSNVHATYSDGIVAAFMLTNTSKKWTAPFGIYNNSMSPDEACIIFFGNTSYSNARAYTRMGNGTSSLTIRSTNTAGTFRNKKLVSVKANNKMSLYYNNSEQGTGQTSSAMSSSFASVGNMLVGTMCRANDAADTDYALVGNLYYVGFGSSRAYVPAKVNGVAGMYDTYNDVFYPSESGTPFTAGPEI